MMNKDFIIPDTIYFTTNLETLLQVVDKTDNMKKCDMLKEEFVRRLAVYVATGSGMVLVSFGENKELNGCMVLARQRDNKGEYIWIDFAWFDSDAPQLRDLFYDEVIGTCKVKGIKRIQMRMNHGFKAMEKLFDAYEIGRILEKKVE